MKNETPDYANEKRVITMTHEQASLLTSYILMTTQYRRREAEAWAKLAEEREPDGTPSFKNAKSNADFYRELDGKLEEIRHIIDAAPFVRGDDA